MRLTNLVLTDKGLYLSLRIKLVILLKDLNLNTVCLSAKGALAYWEMSHLKFRGFFMYSGILSCVTIRYRLLGAEPKKFIGNHAILNRSYHRDSSSVYN
ncbi:3302_t:CDS:2 [Funneliformis caledonium]|uniref:3302_t:CDS:1 n=1 Tax=Funneliformis caledonium TaxID=1117310 RepID=A0A9N8VBS1_9GLOM|nr:3302_t:CDS:2 [Funneliformis caledonium]